jgi:ribosomal protein L18
VTAFIKISFSEPSPPKSTLLLLLHNGINNPPCLVISDSLLALHQKHQEQGILLSLPNKIPSSQVQFPYTLSTRRRGSSTPVYRTDLCVYCREGKTDYYARKRLITQAKNRYATPKYRLVVRFTNTTVVRPPLPNLALSGEKRRLMIQICQIIHSKLQGDIVFASAYSSELPKYGIKHGLKNWAAAYATGLLVARRALTKIGLADKYDGVKEPDGSHTMTEEIQDAGRPFKVFLDVGLRKTSTGSRVFGAMKGASDGGLYIPHSENRFPGYDSESKALDADTLKKYIYGGHVGEVNQPLVFVFG